MDMDYLYDQNCTKQPFFLKRMSCLKDGAEEICSGIGLHQGILSAQVQQAVDEPELLSLLPLPPQGDGGMPHDNSLHFYLYISQFISF